MVDGYGIWSQPIFGDLDTCGSRRWRSWHIAGAGRYGARRVSLVLGGICRRGVNDPFWGGISAAVRQIGKTGKVRLKRKALPIETLKKMLSSRHILLWSRRERK